MKEKILITGACGQTGHELVLALKDKYWIIGIDDLSTGKEEYARDCHEFYKMSIGRIQMSHLKDVKYVVHLARRDNPEYCERFPEGSHNHNVTFSLILFDMCKRAGVEKIIYGSKPGVELFSLQIYMIRMYCSFYKGTVLSLSEKVEDSVKSLVALL